MKGVTMVKQCVILLAAVISVFASLLEVIDLPKGVVLPADVYAVDIVEMDSDNQWRRPNRFYVERSDSLGGELIRLNFNNYYKTNYVFESIYKDGRLIYNRNFWKCQYRHRQSRWEYQFNEDGQLLENLLFESGRSALAPQAGWRQTTKVSPAVDKKLGEEDTVVVFGGNVANSSRDSLLYTHEYRGDGLIETSFMKKLGSDQVVGKIEYRYDPNLNWVSISRYNKNEDNEFELAPRGLIKICRRGDTIIDELFDDLQTPLSKRVRIYDSSGSLCEISEYPNWKDGQYTYGKRYVFLCAPVSITPEKLSHSSSKEFNIIPGGFQYIANVKNRTGEISLFTVTGRKIKSIELTNGVNEIPLRGFAKGIYCVLVTYSDKTRESYRFDYR